MKENDFDDIGKRLHDLEADPPKDGWKKISPVLNVPQQGGTIATLRKHWWKPWIILIPASFFILFTGQDKSKQLSSSLAADSLMAKTWQQRTESSSYDITTRSLSVEAKTNETTESKIENTDLVKSTTSVKSNSLLNNLVIEENTSSNVIRNDEQGIDNNQSLLNEQSITEIEKISQVKEEATSSTIVLGDQREMNREQTLPIAFQHPSTDLTSPSSDSTAAGLGSVLVQQENNFTDTTSLKDVLGKDEDKKAVGPWRLTASFTPQYSANTVKPLTNDEVLMTAVEELSDVQRIGLGFALGAGKAITPNFYVDGQLSFSELQHDIQFSYSTGIVDTLFALQQPDQSVRVTPLYHVDSREISSRYSYGGIRIAGTYYFWSTPRRRFNLTASVGAHYLLKAKVQERINEQWITLSNENLNRLNYSFSAGAGYNINLNKGWELMINPSLTYYFKEVKSQDVPYLLTEESLGLNFMLSKTLGR